MFMTEVDQRANSFSTLKYQKQNDIKYYSSNVSTNQRSQAALQSNSRNQKRYGDGSPSQSEQSAGDRVAQMDQAQLQASKMQISYEVALEQN